VLHEKTQVNYSLADGLAFLVGRELLQAFQILVFHQSGGLTSGLR
jgi:hypothetical protein